MQPHHQFAACSAKQVKLADKLDPAAEDPAAITVFLEQTVSKMIEKAQRQRASNRAPKLPLIRLRVICEALLYAVFVLLTRAILPIMNSCSQCRACRAC